MGAGILSAPRRTAALWSLQLHKCRSSDDGSAATRIKPCSPWVGICRRGTCPLPVINWGPTGMPPPSGTVYIPRLGPPV